MRGKGNKLINTTLFLPITHNGYCNLYQHYFSCPEDDNDEEDYDMMMVIVMTTTTTIELKILCLVVIIIFNNRISIP